MGTSGWHCRTSGRPSAKRNFRATTLGVLILTAASNSGRDWPPFLPGREAFSPAIVDGIERVWTDPTLVRRVQGPSAHVPADLYAAFVDAPDVTAAAARLLKLAEYEVRVVERDWYVADDHTGARGLYHVLLREPGRRVILSWGEHSGSILGTIGGSALSVLEFEEHDGAIEQRIEAYVRIENRAAAVLARLLIPLFGGVADRKLTEGFAVTAKVARWAVERPAEFCRWLRADPLPPERRERLLGLIADCR